MSKFFILIVLFVSLISACSSSPKEDTNKLSPIRVRLVLKKAQLKNDNVVNENKNDFIIDIKIKELIQKNIKEITVNLDLEEIISKIKNKNIIPTVAHLINNKEARIDKKNLAKKEKLAHLTIQ